MNREYNIRRIYTITTVNATLILSITTEKKNCKNFSQTNFLL